VIDFLPVSDSRTIAVVGEVYCGTLLRDWGGWWWLPRCGEWIDTRQAEEGGARGWVREQEREARKVVGQHA
jgi:hypothetical protein